MFLFETQNRFIVQVEVYLFYVFFPRFLCSRVPTTGAMDIYK